MRSESTEADTCVNYAGFLNGLKTLPSTQSFLNQEAWSISENEIEI